MCHASAPVALTDCRHVHTGMDRSAADRVEALLDNWSGPKYHADVTRASEP
jgi:hypothetical protein